jgi:NADPH:quinone reductase-like Zn-dependent oxidoreductase
VIDYTKEDFTKGNQRYDVILDNVANHSLSECRRVLNRNGVYVLIGGGGFNEGRWVGPGLSHALKALLLSQFVSQKMGMMLAELNHDDLAYLADLMQSGKVKPVIDRTYKLGDLPDAIRYLEQGHARGKVVVAVE